MREIREYNINGTIILGVDNGYGNVKTLFKRLNLVGISNEDVLKKLDEHKERVNGL